MAKVWRIRVLRQKAVPLESFPGRARKWARLIGSWALFGFAADGCSGQSNHVEISGKSAGDGAMTAAEAICRNEASCGTAQISCMGGTDMPNKCSAVIVPTAYDACLSDVKGGLERVLSCAAITAEQVDMVELCADALAARPCVTQAEADAAARAAETGMSLPASPLPPECTFLMQPLPGCS